MANDLLSQADNVWKMLDELAEDDPEAYKKFISENLKQGQDFFAMPEPKLAIRVSYSAKDEGNLYINIFNWDRMPQPKSDTSSIPLLATEVLKTSNPNRPSEQVNVICVVLNSITYEEAMKTKQDEIDLLELVVTFIREAKHLSVLTKYVKLKSKLIGNLQDMLDMIKKASENSNESYIASISEQKRSKPKTDSIMSQLGLIVDSQSSSQYTPSMPEFKGNSSNENLKAPIIEEIHVSKTTPKYILSEKSGNTLQLKIDLPLIENVNEIDLEISQRDAELTSSHYALNVKFSRTIDDNKIDAKFDRATKCLTISAPIN